MWLLHVDERETFLIAQLHLQCPEIFLGVLREVWNVPDTWQNSRHWNRSCWIIGFRFCQPWNHSARSVPSASSSRSWCSASFSSRASRLIWSALVHCAMRAAVVTCTATSSPMPAASATSCRKSSAITLEKQSPCFQLRYGTSCLQNVNRVPDVKQNLIAEMCFCCEQKKVRTKILLVCLADVIFARLHAGFKCSLLVLGTEGGEFRVKNVKNCNFVLSVVFRLSFWCSL